MARDVNEAEFEALVLERSREVPVVVDFWAAWCAPCRLLGPVLERVAASHDGRVDLVKVDVDANPVLAARYAVQGIPAVKAFRDGRVVGEFTGAYPEQAVGEFFEDLLAAEEEQAGRAATLAGARAAIEAGDLEEARRLIAPLLPEEEAARMEAEVDLREAGVPGDYEAALDRLLGEVRAGDRGAARDLMVKIFRVLGDEHPLTRRFRPALARALF